MNEKNAAQETAEGARGATHTPGPWREVGRDIYAGERANTVRIATADSLADVGLIAAAPALLEAAERAVTHFTDTFARVRALTAGERAVVEVLESAVHAARGADVEGENR